MFVDAGFLAKLIFYITIGLGLFSITILAFYFFFIKKNEKLYRSVNNQAWRSKSTMVIVILFYALSFGAIGGTLIASERISNGVEEVAVDNKMQHVNTSADESTWNNMIDPNTGTVNQESAKLIAPGVDYTLVDTESELDSWVYNTYCNATCKTTYNTVLSWTNALDSTYGTKEAYYLAIAITNYVNQWNIDSANDFDVYYQMDTYKIWKPTTSAETDESYMVMNLNNFDYTTDYADSLAGEDGETLFRNNGDTSDRETDYLGHPEWYWVAEENEDGQDGLERLYSFSGDTNGDGNNENDQLGSVGNPYVVAVNQDWYETNDARIDENNVFVVDGKHHFEIVATFRLPNYLYPMHDYQSAFVDLSQQAMMIVNTQQFKTMGFVDGEMQYSIFFGYSNIYEQVSKSNDYAATALHEQTATQTEIFLSSNPDDGFVSLVEAFDLNTIANYYEVGETFESARTYSPYYAIDFNITLSILLLALILSITIFLMILLIKKRIKDNSNSIGILKAMGYKNRDISLAYVTFPLLIIGLGFLGAMVASLGVQWFWMVYIGDMMAVNLGGLIITWKSVMLMLVVPLLALVAATYFFTQLALRKPIVELLSQRAVYAPNILVRATGKATASMKTFGLSYGIKNVFRTIGKSTLLVVSILFSAILVSLALASMNTTSNLIESSMSTYNYEYYTTLQSDQDSSFTAYEDTNGNGTTSDELELIFSTQTAYTFGMTYSTTQTMKYDRNDIINAANTQARIDIYNDIMTTVDTYIRTTAVATYTTEWTYKYIDSDDLFELFTYYTWFSYVDAVDLETADGVEDTTLYLSDYGAQEIRMSDLDPLMEGLFISSTINTFGDSPYDVASMEEFITEEEAVQIATIQSMLDSIEATKPQYYSFKNNYYNTHTTVPIINTQMNWTKTTTGASPSWYVTIFEDSEDISKVYNFDGLTDDELLALDQTYSDYNGKIIIPVIVSESQLEELNEEATKIQNGNITYYDVNNFGGLDFGRVMDYNFTHESNSDVYIQVVGTYTNDYDYVLTTMKHFTTWMDSEHDTVDTYLYTEYLYYDNNAAQDVFTLEHYMPASPTSGDNVYLYSDKDPSPTNNYTIDWYPQYYIPLSISLLEDQLVEFYNIISIFFILFAVIVMSVAMSIIVIAMKEIINNAKREIALLKAFGYSTNRAASLVLLPYIVVMMATFIITVPVVIVSLTTFTVLFSLLLGSTVPFTMGLSQWFILYGVIIGFMSILFIIGWISFGRVKPIKALQETT